MTCVRPGGLLHRALAEAGATIDEDQLVAWGPRSARHIGPELQDSSPEPRGSPLGDVDVDGEGPPPPPTLSASRCTSFSESALCDVAREFSELLWLLCRIEGPSKRPTAAVEMLDKFMGETRSCAEKCAADTWEWFPLGASSPIFWVLAHPMLVFHTVAAALLSRGRKTFLAHALLRLVYAVVMHQAKRASRRAVLRLAIATAEMLRSFVLLSAAVETASASTVPAAREPVPLRRALRVILKSASVGHHAFGLLQQHDKDGLTWVLPSGVEIANARDAARMIRESRVGLLEAAYYGGRAIRRSVDSLALFDEGTPREVARRMRLLLTASNAAAQLTTVRDHLDDALLLSRESAASVSGSPALRVGLQLAARVDGDLWLLRQGDIDCDDAIGTYTRLRETAALLGMWCDAQQKNLSAPSLAPAAAPPSQVANSDASVHGASDTSCGEGGVSENGAPAPRGDAEAFEGAAAGKDLPLGSSSYDDVPRRRLPLLGGLGRAAPVVRCDVMSSAGSEAALPQERSAPEAATGGADGAADLCGRAASQEDLVLRELKARLGGRKR